MVLQTSGTISLSQINAEMNNSSPGVIYLSAFRANGNTKARGVTGIPTSGTLRLSNFYGKLAIPVTNGLIGKYTGESFDTVNKVLRDETGSGNDTNESKAGTINVVTSSFTNNKYISGGLTSGLRFPSTILPSSYTFFGLSRWNGSNLLRIFDGIDYNWLSGHWAGASGVAFHEGFVGSSSQINRFMNTWVLSSDQINLYRANGIQLGNSGGSRGARISINHGGFTGDSAFERSEWAVYCVFVYNRELSSAEILQMENYLFTFYQTTIMTHANWYTLFNRTTNGYTISQSGSDPDVQLQLNSEYGIGGVTGLNYIKRIQDYSSFVVQFDIYMSGTADGASFNVGFNGTEFWGEGPNAPGFSIGFQLWTGDGKSQGIYLYDSNGSQVGFYSMTLNNSTWIPVKIHYTRSTSNTWQITINTSSLIIVYSNPNNESWVTSTSGSYFGFGSRTGLYKHSSYIRRFSLSVQD